MSSPQLKQFWKTQASDYVTAIDWIGEKLAIASAAGEVILVDQNSACTLREADSQSIDCLAVSSSGKYLAAGGQNSQVEIWEIASTTLVATLEYPRSWIDKLVWHPLENLLAFSIGKQIQVWDADAGASVAELDFAGSSAMDLVWHPQGEALAVGGYLGTKIWRSEDWSAAPQVVEVPSVSVKIGWSKDGKYFASGNLDRMITLVEAGNFENPWAMRGFPGKIRCLAWSDQQLLAVSSQDGIAVWHYLAEAANWDAEVLDHHGESVQALAFQPGSNMLASVANDGLLCLVQGETLPRWKSLRTPGVCLAWNAAGNQLAVGMQDGTTAVFSV